MPHLPLEANAARPSPSAVVDNARVVLADAAAQAAGVGRGTGVAAARLLSPSIALLARDRARETATMETLACWAGAFTPRVSLTSDTLLLEVGGCLRLFGGLEPLVQAVAAGVQAQGFCAALAAAPTPLGAQWLAQSGASSLCRDRDALHRQLEQLTVDVLPAKTADSLKRFGAQTLADARRLPGAELARRLGDGCRRAMAQAFGELPDPRADFVFPARFAQSLELPAPVDHASALLFAARRLASALSGWLAVRQAGVREFCLQLAHRRQETLLWLKFSAPTADQQRFERVLRERLEHTFLTAPVDALRLVAAQIAALPGRNQTLFPDAGSAQEAIDALIERLAARLGERQLYRLAMRDDHRPECATQRVAPLAAPVPQREPAPAKPRPLWLVDPPQPLTEVDGRPQRRGALRLLAGPERIESGWWDSGEALGDVRRDYFVALSNDGGWLWIYRDVKLPGGWFLHGYFA